MTGLPNYNFPAFDIGPRNNCVAWATSHLVPLGGGAEPPDGGDTSKPRPYYLRKAIALLLEADAIILLPDWKTSAGARLEMAIARELELPVVQLDSSSSE